MKRLLWALLTIGLFAGLAIIGAADSHHTNAQYILWKWGLAPCWEGVAPRYLNVDPDIRESLRGKSKHEIKRWFPTLVVPGETTNEYQRSYYKLINGSEFLWVGDSAWAIEFENGRVKEFHLIKG